MSRNRRSNTKKQQGNKKRSGNPASPKNIPTPREPLDLSGLRAGNPFGDPSGLSFLQRLAGAGSARPDWFGPSIEGILDEAEVLLDAQGPRQLEDMTARLLGAHVHKAVQDEHSLFLGNWVEELIAVAERRARLPVAGAPGSRAANLLLHGLTSVGSPAVAHMADAALSRLQPVVNGADSGEDWPDWLNSAAKPLMTGDVWTMRDVYGSRLGVIAATNYPNGADPAVYLFDIDACGFVVLAGGGTFDDVQQAAAAWRTAVGAAAADCVPQPLDKAHTEALRCLIEVDLSEITIRGTESRAVWDEWFRALRRIHDLSDTLQRHGSSLPTPLNLYQDIDVTPTVEAFSAWLRQEHGEEPDPEAVEALVGEWLEGALPDTADSVSPHRIEHQLGLINDWIPDHPATIGAKRLLPHWVRFLAQRAKLPDTAAAAALATLATVSGGGHRAAEHCRDVH
ncbi:hypothetical protein C7C46_21160 [Streptomyces tateyamensis]|uniref:Uncharacterized protein n=1 Tax=Streptomyces tateyamensis TaxID=565073 RepID=A0A2V4N5T8_9ACTN|nr:hypothetical protein [Streptomyces tateyamensis]PYC76901.1 hypothetical protein C7C46_21160 [Streptomyces tateyamensis]